MNILDVLRKDSFFFMRDEPPDVKRYLPQYLNNDQLFSAIQDALNIEHDNYRLKLVDVAKQFFLETATWGLDDWERFLKITPSAGASEDLRRAVIRVKRRGDTVMTVENTRRLLEDFAPRGEVGIRELGENKLELLIHNGTFWWSELMAALWEQLPAHLTFDFELSRTIDFPHYVALVDLLQGWIQYDQRYRESATQSLQVVQGLVTTGNVLFDVSSKHVVNRASQTVRVGFVEIIHGKIRFDCENELPDEETIEDFERYLRRRWRDFKQNPVVEHYRHNEHGDWDESEIDDPNNPDEEFFPIDRDFLRLYWKFPYETKKGEQRVHVRTTTILDPRQDITSGEIKALGNIGAAGEIFTWRKDRIVTSGILRAMYVHKKEMKII